VAAIVDVTELTWDETRRLAPADFAAAGDHLEVVVTAVEVLITAADRGTRRLRAALLGDRATRRRCPAAARPLPRCCPSRSGVR